MTIAVFGNYGVGNLGDELILRGFLSCHAHDQIIVFCGRPDQVRQDLKREAYSFFPGGLRSILRYCLSSEYRESIRKSFQALCSVDTIVIGGGGILVDRRFKAVFLWWRQLFHIVNSRKPYSFVANSFELRHFWSRSLFRPYLREAQLISVRDRASQQFAEQIGVTSTLVEDLALSAPEITSAVNEPAPTIPRKPLLCLALCQWGLGQVQHEALRFLIQAKRKEGYEVVGLAFQTQGDDDREVYRALDPTIPVFSGLEPVMEQLKSCDHVIAMRYHAVLLGLQFQKNVIAIAYQNKVQALMRDRGLEKDCVRIKDLKYPLPPAFEA